MVGGVPKNQNLPFHLDKLLAVIANRFYYKIRSFKNIHMADFDSVHAHLLLPTKFLFKWLDWKKALTSPQMEHSFGTFLLSSRGSSVLYLCSVIIVISAWIPKREKKKRLNGDDPHEWAVHLHSCLRLLGKAVYVCRIFKSVRMEMIELKPTLYLQKEDYRKACYILLPQFFFQMIQ